MQNLEKALKKNQRIITILIIIVALLLVYSLTVAGDISSAKGKTERSYNDVIAEINEDIADVQEDTAECEEDIAKYEAEIAELTADIEAINNGTYVDD